jgi:hypothetical protein
MKRNATGAEPVGNFADVLFAVRVIQVLPRAENLDGLRAAAYQLVEQARMQPLSNVDIGGNRLQHRQNSIVCGLLRLAQRAGASQMTQDYAARVFRLRTPAGFLAGFAFAATISYDFEMTSRSSESFSASGPASVTHL